MFRKAKQDGGSWHVEVVLAGGGFVGVPSCDDACAEHVVGEPCEAVSGVGVEGELEVLVGFGSSAFPPVDVADGGEDGCCVFWGGEGVGVGEELFGPFDARPVRCCGGLGEEDAFGRFVDAGDVCHEPVADVRELEVGDELQDVLVGGVVLGLQHCGPELVSVVGGIRWRPAEDGLFVVFDGGCVLLLVGRRWEEQMVRRFDGAAAVDEFGVDL